MNDGPEEGGFRAGIETGPDGKSTGNIICYPSFSPNCKVVTLPTGGAAGGFLSLPEPTRFHDGILIKATQEINHILSKVAKETKGNPEKTNLHLFLADEGPMLIWVSAMAMRTDDIRDAAAMKHSA